MGPRSQSHCEKHFKSSFSKSYSKGKLFTGITNRANSKLGIKKPKEEELEDSFEKYEKKAEKITT
jgi:hypothetical protein